MVESIIAKIRQDYGNNYEINNTTALVPVSACADLKDPRTAVDGQERIVVTNLPYFDAMRGLEKDVTLAAIGRANQGERPFGGHKTAKAAYDRIGDTSEVTELSDRLVKLAVTYHGEPADALAAVNHAFLRTYGEPIAPPEKVTGADVAAEVKAIQASNTTGAEMSKKG